MGEGGGQLRRRPPLLVVLSPRFLRGCYGASVSRLFLCRGLLRRIQRNLLPAQKRMPRVCGGACSQGAEAATLAASDPARNSAALRRADGHLSAGNFSLPAGQAFAVPAALPVPPSRS